MSIFYNKNEKLVKINEKNFVIEKHLQNLIEANLHNLMGLTFIKTEFYLKNCRIDTLAYDETAHAFVIIEYKRSKNTSVIDQGFTYLNLLLNNKAEFILEFNEIMKRNIKKSDIDWSQTKVVFVAPSFNTYQYEATNFKDIGIELWEIKKYENNIFSINPVKRNRYLESIKTLTKNSPILEKITKEIKNYTEEQLLEKANAEIKELYEEFKCAILNLDSSIEIVPLKHYISFKKTTNICDIEVWKNSLYIFLNAKWSMLDDSRHLFLNMSEKGHHGNGDYKIKISDNGNLEYIISVLKQLL